MIPVSGFEDFKGKFSSVKDLRELYVFLLFDEPREKVVQTFVDKQFDWLDRLAAASNVFGFAFVHRDLDTGRIVNPSLQVAELFDIRPIQLPGVVVFSMLPGDENVSGAVYLPLKPEVLDDGQAGLEPFFRELFSRLQDAQESSISGGTSIERFEKLIRDAGTAERRATVGKYAWSQIQGITKFPAKLVESLTKAFAEAVAKQAFGG